MRITLLSVSLLAACGPVTIGPTPEEAIVTSRVTESTLVASFERDGDFWVSPVLDAPGAATVVGAMIDARGEEPLALEARSVDVLTGEGPWLPLRETWREGTLRVARTELEQITESAQLRLPASDLGRVREIIWSPVIPQTHDPEPYLVEPRADALLPNFAPWDVQPRSAWQARNPACSRADERKTRMTVHHTAGSPGDPSSFDAKLRQIQAYHMDTNGWCDIGYHFLVSLDGTVWEGRELFDVGAHVLEHNSANIGVSFMGCFHPTSDCAGITPLVPPDEMVAAGGEITGVLAHIYELPIDAATIKGHRDYSGTATSCPGDNLESRLDDLRAVAAVTLTQFEGQCGCDLTNACDDGCSCDACVEKEDGGCASVSAPPWVALALLLLGVRRRTS